MNTPFRTVILLLLILLTALPLAAQDNSHKSRYEEGQLAVIANMEYIITREIAHSNEDYSITIARIGVERWFSNWWSLRFEVEPLFRATSDVRPDQSALGIGVVWSAYFEPYQGVEPFFSAELGFTRWEEDFPVGDSLEYNFTIAFSGGLIIPFDSHNGLMVGTRYWHLSNNNFGNRNPGINGFSFFGGYRYLF